MRITIKKFQTGRDSGFTLIEVMLVVMIIGIMAGLVVLNVSSVSRSSVVTACKTDWRVVDNAIKAYQNDNKSNPTTTSASSFTNENLYDSATSTLVKNGYMSVLTAVSQVKSSYKIGILYQSFPSYTVVVTDLSVTKRLAATGSASSVNECDLIP